MAKRYQDIKVGLHVNVSSSRHYHFKVYWKGGRRDYSLGVGFLANRPDLLEWEGAPGYLTKEVEAQIAAMFRDGTAKFYEYDRDGNKRYENLRYYDADEVASWVKWLTEEHSAAS